MEASSLHIAMFPWFAMGHLTPYLHLSNKLAKRGHKISFFIPRRTQSKLEQFNLFPHLITFYPINVPHVEGLPHGAETTSDVSFSLAPLIMTAMDRTEKDIELLLNQLKPQIVFFDFTHWLPNLTRPMGIKSFQYSIVGPATVSYVRSPPRMSQNMTERDLMQPPFGYPVSSIKLHAHEAKFLASIGNWEFGSGVLFYDRLNTGLILSDAIGFKGCREIEGPYVDYLAKQFGKSVLLSGPIIPEPPNTVLEEKWSAWLGRFEDGSVVFCALGSEWKLPHDQFLELVLGLELTGLPFLAVVKVPIGFETIEAALPEGFKERVEGRGIVDSGWIQQQLILQHPSVGCFITHCGAGSLTEALVNKCQMVLLPQLGGDHVINARMMGRNLKVGVEVEKGEEDGLFTKESVSIAVKIVMDEENDVGKEVRANHAKLRNFWVSRDLESTCVDDFCRKLHDLLK
ncbi:UDP-glycosyltransferase 79B30-like [Vigna unguiculata]|uniref:UDP-glucosyl transferase 73C n=1 Tax=Vigna unguiculata TaxID=3917 RepID=A0A4D6NCZ1_VIGUN|nr:UDP-glycosyltransferase 79B30-like [Vigna unguiculata]QCE09787.1 UDP-glucosyl transferase 73C [Vigna unguiculata]WMX26810.1 UGT79B134 [Vigna unguiculata]